MIKKLLIIPLFINLLTIQLYANSYQITIHYPYDDIQFDLYYIADIKSNEIIFKDEYKEICQQILWNKDIQKNAYTLSSYINYYKIRPTLSTTTQNEQAIFNIQKNKIYLIIDKQNKILPILLNTNQSIDIYPKSTNQTYSTINILKIWNDNKENHQEIEIDIFNSKGIIQTIKLNENNHYQYQITLEKDNYQIIEKNIPNEYKVTIEKQDNLFIITNTSPITLDNTLPNTSILYWPIPLLFILGIYFLYLGYNKK